LEKVLERLAANNGIVGKTYEWPNGYDNDPVIRHNKNKTIITLTRMIESQAYRLRIDAGIWT
jgi:hypothetical protein